MRRVTDVRMGPDIPWQFDRVNEQSYLRTDTQMMGEGFTVLIVGFTQVMPDLRITLRGTFVMTVSTGVLISRIAAEPDRQLIPPLSCVCQAGQIAIIPYEY